MNSNKKSKGQRCVPNKSPVPAKQRALPVVVPPVYVTTHKYTSHIIAYNPGSLLYGAFDYYINTPFIPDVSGTDTSSAIGAFQMQAFYNRSLVLSAKIKIRVVNEEDFDIAFTAAPSTKALDPLIGSASEVLELAEMPWGKSMILGRNTGMDRGTMIIYVNNSKLAGSKMTYNAEAGYVGFGSAYPSYKQYITFGIASVGTKVFVEGITFVLDIDYKIRWYDRQYTDISLMNKLRVVTKNEEREKRSKRFKLLGGSNTTNSSSV